MPNIIMADQKGGGGSDLSVLEIYIADFVGEPPTVTDGALDGWRRCVVSS